MMRYANIPMRSSLDAFLPYSSAHGLRFDRTNGVSLLHVLDGIRSTVDKTDKFVARRAIEIHVIQI